MQKPNQRRSADLAMIHIAKKELGLDEDTYRNMLWTVARVSSSSALDHAGRAAVLDHLKGRGWANKTKAPDVAKAKQKLMSKIAALLADMKLPWEYAQGIAKQMYKREQLQWCTPFELRGIITALVKRAKTHAATNTATAESDEA